MNKKDLIEQILNGDEEAKISATGSLTEKNFEYSELINFLKTDSLELIQFALVSLKEVQNDEDSTLICSFLINHPSEIREFSSFLVNNLIKNENFRKFFQKIEFLEIFEKTIYDVNPKVCRKILEILPFLNFAPQLMKNIIENTFELIEFLNEKDKQKNREYNKKAFHLYWNLFALSELVKFEDISGNYDDILRIIKHSKDFKEYTIREKGSLLIKALCSRVENQETRSLYEQFLKDENFYVRNAAGCQK